MANNFNLGNGDPSQAQSVYGTAHGQLAQQLSGAGARYELSRIFGGGYIDESRIVGHIYIRTETGNIYMIDAAQRTITDLRRSIEAKSEQTGVLDQFTRQVGVIQAGRPFLFSTERTEGATSAVTEIVVVHDNLRQAMEFGSEPNRNLPPFTLVDEFDQAIAKLPR